MEIIRDNLKKEMKEKVMFLADEICKELDIKIDNIFDSLDIKEDVQKSTPKKRVVKKAVTNPSGAMTSRDQDEKGLVTEEEDEENTKTVGVNLIRKKTSQRKKAPPVSKKKVSVKKEERKEEEKEEDIEPHKETKKRQMCVSEDADVVIYQNYGPGILCFLRNITKNEKAEKIIKDQNLTYTLSNAKEKAESGGYMLPDKNLDDILDLFEREKVKYQLTEYIKPPKTKFENVPALTKLKNNAALYSNNAPEKAVEEIKPIPCLTMRKGSTQEKKNIKQEKDIPQEKAADQEKKIAAQEKKDIPQKKKDIIQQDPPSEKVKPKVGKNKWGNLEEKTTGFVFCIKRGSDKTRPVYEVVGVQDHDTEEDGLGSLVPLSEENVKTCLKKGWNYNTKKIRYAE
jgi:hypothetical protein